LNQPDVTGGRREIQVPEAEEALQELRPFLRPNTTEEAKLVLTRIVSKYHSGPIPSAEELEYLERILPGAANRCFEMAEREQAHRHRVSEDIVTKEFSLRGRGQWLAIAALVLLLIVVAYLAYQKDTEAAAWLGAATIVGVVSVFVTGKIIEKTDSSAEAEEKPPEPPASDRNLTRQQRRARDRTGR